MIFGLPIPLLGSAFGAIMGWLTKRQAMNTEVEAASRKFQLEAMMSVAKVNSQAVDDEIKLLKARGEYEKVTGSCQHKSVPRRVISYLLLATICFVIPGAVLFGDIQWFEFHKWTTPGFFGLGRQSVVEVVTAVGLPLAWLEGLLTLVSTIIGYYFGNSSARYNNPFVK